MLLSESSIVPLKTWEAHIGDWNEGDPRQYRIRSYAEYIRALDPYDHPIVIHTYPNQHIEVYTPLLGDAFELAGISLQTHWNRVHEHTLLWRRVSAAAGKKWVIANDEQGDPNYSRLAGN